jgi:hypothetical protein
VGVCISSWWSGWSSKFCGLLIHQHRGDRAVGSGGFLSYACYCFCLFFVASVLPMLEMISTVLIAQATQCRKFKINWIKYEGSGRGIIWGTVCVSDWRDWEKRHRNHCHGIRYSWPDLNQRRSKCEGGSLASRQLYLVLTGMNEIFNKIKCSCKRDHYSPPYPNIYNTFTLSFHLHFIY